MQLLQFSSSIGLVRFICTKRGLLTSCPRRKPSWPKLACYGSQLDAPNCSLATSSMTPQTFDDILSSENRLRCQSYLGSRPPVDPKKLPWLRGRDITTMKPAAVLVPFCHFDGQPSVLLTLRSIHLSSHKGEVSFPGGMVEDSDTSAVNTALREVEEEIGLKGEIVDVLGQLSPVPGRNYRSLVTPIIGYCGAVDIKNLKINTKEVNEVFAVSLASLCSEENIRYTTYKSTTTFSMPVFIGQKHKIWGMTAIMLHQILTIIAPGLYKFKISPFSVNDANKKWNGPSSVV